MEKNVYSLVLMDDVVREVDRVAREMGLSRSALINRWLAEKVNLSTPEQRYREVFLGVRRLIDGQEALTVLSQPRSGQMLVRSVLCCRYSPALIYSVVLGAQAPELGELRVSTRSQRAEPLAAVTDFFEMWATLEQAHIAPRLHHPVAYTIGPGRYRRRLLRPQRESWTARQQGEAIAGYIARFDRLLKLYFAHLGEPGLPDIIESAYAASLEDGEAIL